ncbi:FolM Alternative dihydrofolate reductase 1 [Marinobacterium lacunae]|uniref:FolM Alternative dihydrofolate reductase 1 n=1 Tax=Marinobacterium lacunae TaxID=1232683 RepID=A0A081G039_9GAMM|nr:dihydromonapterin reductase [Marinobacterium lacunae]KEA64144.1 FolM Alternative dihydrofolate reductase 1 [Marinobacterium lacunae]
MTKPSILITGGAQRIGLHCARRLVDDGYPVIITCRTQRAEWTEHPLDGIEVIEADFSTCAGVQALIDQLNDREIRLRALIHNASVWMGDDDSGEAFQQMFAVHMQTPYLLNQAARRWFEPGQPADIIHMTDYVAQRGARHMAYAATKAGLESLTLSFASQLAPAIKVNSIAPSLIMFNDEDDPEYRAKALAKSALGIEPGPDVVYQAVRYLLDNPYVTGTCMELNGGRNLR